MKTGESSPVFLCIFGEFSREWRTFLDNFPGNPHNKSNSFYFCFLSKESPGPRDQFAAPAGKFHKNSTQKSIEWRRIWNWRTFPKKRWLTCGRLPRWRGSNRSPSIAKTNCCKNYGIYRRHRRPRRRRRTSRLQKSRRTRIRLRGGGAPGRGAACTRGTKSPAAAGIPHRGGR